MTPVRKIVKVAPIIAASAALVLVAGCGGSGGGSDNGSKETSSAASSSSPAAEAPADQVPAGAVKVELSEYHFMPSTINVKAGKVTLYLVNTGVVPHDIVVQLPSGKKKSPEIAAGAKQAWEVGDVKAGSYKVNCDLPGHTESGMVGKLVAK